MAFCRGLLPVGTPSTIMSTSTLPLKEGTPGLLSIGANKCTASWFPSLVSYWLTGKAGATACRVRERETEVGEKESVCVGGGGKEVHITKEKRRGERSEDRIGVMKRSTSHFNCDGKPISSYVWCIAILDNLQGICAVLCATSVATNARNVKQALILHRNTGTG